MARSILTALAALVATTSIAVAQPDVAPATPAAQDPAGQLVGLFAETCLRYGDDPTALRQALAQQGVPRLSAQADAFFLAGRRGIGYDASLPGLRLALVSGDDGTCSAYAENAPEAAVRADLAQALAPDSPRMLPPPAAAAAPGLHGTAEQVVLDGRRFTIFTVTTDQPGQIQAALTLRAG